MEKEKRVNNVKCMYILLFGLLYFVLLLCSINLLH